MARSDLLIKLVRASVAGDQSAVRAAVETIIAEEKRKQHTVLADRLTRAMQTNGSGISKPTSPSVSKPARKGREFLAEITPRRSLRDMVLSKTCCAVRLTARPCLRQRSPTARPRTEPHPSHTALGGMGRMLIVGPTGTGKSALLSLIALQFLCYAGSQVTIFDKGNSARAAVLAMGEEHHALGAAPDDITNALAFQPLRIIGRASNPSPRPSTRRSRPVG